MYKLYQTLTTKDLLVQQLPSLGLSLIIAEMFYKFHSFTLECIAFLGTWYALDLAGHAIRDRLENKSSD